MIDTVSVKDPSDEVRKTKASNLPSTSRPALVQRRTDDSEEGIDGSSLNFENLMGVESPEGVDFHASYDQVPKAEVNLKMKKQFNNSCPSFMGRKTREPAVDHGSWPMRGKKNEKAQSATRENKAPSRSLSFTSTPPQHFDIEVPKPISPCRTRSMQNSFPIGGPFEENTKSTSRSVFSSEGAFKYLHKSLTSISIEPRRQKIMPVLTQRSFTVVPSESGEFYAAPLATKGDNPIQSIARSKVMKHSPEVGVDTRSNEPRSPQRSRSLDPVQFDDSHSPRACEGHSGGLSSESRWTPPPRSKSLDELAMAMFKSPVKYDISKRHSHSRRPTQRSTDTPEHSRRKTIVPARPIPFSPRRGSKRSSFLVRSKSTKLAKSSGCVVAADSDATSSGVTSNFPRRVKSLHSALTKKSPSTEKARLRLNLPATATSPRIFLDDNVSVSASEAVPIATFASSKSSVGNPEQKSQLRKAFKETLGLVGKWKRKSKEEDKHSLRRLRTADIELHDSKNEAPATPQTCGTTTSEELSRTKDDRKQVHRTRSRKNVVRDHMSKGSSSYIEKETRQSNGSKSTAKTVCQDATKDSLADALDEKEARLADYMTKTPKAKRKKVDRYWIEAFKRNYARRNDSKGVSHARNKANS